MKNLKNNSSLILTFCVFLFGCQSKPSFVMTTLENEELHSIKVERKRVIHECYFLNAEKENNWRHQYILYILNGKNEAIPIFFPTNQGKSECQTHLKKVEKILKNQERVQFCTRNKLERMSGSDSAIELHDFKELGKYESPFYALTFDTICNSKECFSISDTWTTTCSRESLLP